MWEMQEGGKITTTQSRNHMQAGTHAPAECVRHVECCERVCLRLDAQVCEHVAHQWLLDEAAPKRLAPILHQTDRQTRKDSSMYSNR